MNSLLTLIRRNVKLFFKDKGMFFSSLITPVILLVLYGTFLGRVYRENFLSSMPAGFQLPESLIDGLVGGQLISSILAVSCVTVAFCSNMLMVQDKVTGARRDLMVTPVKRSHLAIGYYAASLLTTLIVCLVAVGASLCYLSLVGWYLSVGDVLQLLLDVFLLAMFGTALSSIVNCFLSTEGQISAVGTVVSAGYGFLCGAYMPVSQFGEGLQRVLAFLPGTYGTGLLRNHALNGALVEMETQGVPAEVTATIRDTLDCNLYFFGHRVGPDAMYLIVSGSVLVLVAIYVGISVWRGKKAQR
ncbi:MAG: ABC transporter permease [Oscillospiraceae bacterium]|jgi:multidrug/hemolysin transport system permease protein